MSFITPVLDTIRTKFLRNIKNQNQKADIDTDSDVYIRGSATASTAEGLYEHQKWVAKQIFPDTADPEYLLLHCSLRGMTRKKAVVAAGTVTVTGTVGAAVASGLVVKYSDTVTYTTTSGGNIGADGTLIVSVTATTAGASGNRAVGDALTLTIPPTNVNAAVTVVSISGGTDIETYDALLARLLVRIRNPPAGGNKYDFYTWAMNVAGVTQAYVYPLRRGLGTCDVVITSSDGLPTAETLALCQAYIDSQRPVTGKNSLVLAPVIKSYDVAVQVLLSGVTIDAATASVKADLAAYDESIAPGISAVKSRMEGIVTDVSGVTDRLLTLPVANIIPTVDETRVEWCRLGAVNVTLMGST